MFEYGVPHMMDTRLAFRVEDLTAVRQFDDPEEYQSLLAECSSNRPDMSTR
jgi:hypothetical protein